MTRKAAYLLALLLVSAIARAGGPDDGAALRLRLLPALWMDSSNAAGLAFSAPERFNTLQAGYDHASGDYRRMQEGVSVSELSFDTSGAMKVGKVQLWGHFRYDNITDTGASFNTLLYDPFDERFLYTAADTVAGQWKKQSYLMEFKAALPVSESLSAGVHVRYNDRIAAGQIDPRAESYNYSVSVRPGLSWRTGRSIFGLNGLYTNTFERSTPTISNSQEIQRVFLLRGLGNWVGDQVGGSGLSTMYFRCNTWGGSLQYSLESPFKLLASVGYSYHKTDIRESATQPKPHGSTKRHEIEGAVTAVFGSTVRHKAGLSVTGAKTIGTEPTTQWNTASGEWEVTFSADQCDFLTGDALLSYEALILDGDSYSWRFTGNAGIQSKSDTYALPAASFSYTNLSLGAGAGRRFAFNRSSLILEAGIKGIKNLGHAYDYTGHRTGTAPVRDLYPHDIAVLGADLVKGSLGAEFAIALNKGLSLAFAAEGSYLVAFSSLGPLSRWTAAGGVKLYF